MTGEPAFRATGDGIEVVDHIDGHRYTLETPAATAATPASAPTDRLAFPVDSAVTVTAAGFELPTVVATYVRDETATVLAEIQHSGEVSFPPGTYSVELCAPVKLYLRVESALTVRATESGMAVEFGGPTEVVVGARSHHERPAATVTTTADPADVMAAVSTFGSALKTTSPERSFPSLRGHPPEVERGDRLDIPAGLDRPETGLALELPPERRYAYVAAPLAYYLGAEVVPGGTPRLVADTGFEHALPEGDAFEDAVERALKQVFLLDCVARTEGYYPVDLHERRAVEAALDLDFGALYDAAPAERVAAYLGVPFDAVADHVPAWDLTTRVSPAPDGVEALPFLVDDLAVVRTPRETGDASAQAASIEGFLRDGDFTRGAATGGTRAAAGDDSGRLWVGDGAPTGTNTATTTAFRNRVGRSPSAGDIDITVVCNDPAMDEERGVVDEVYGAGRSLPFDVTVRRGLGREELADVLAADADLLHYIGHNDDDGFECADGSLDAAGLDSVGVEAFLLNACRSYEQGRALIEGGSIGGVVTLSDVVNDAAVRVGSTVARLLNRGFPLRAALSIAREESPMGGQYVVVGDGSIAIAQTESGTPLLVEAERNGDGFVVDIETYVPPEGGMGSMFIPYIGDNDRFFLNPGTVGPFRVSAAELDAFLDRETVPLRVGGELLWSDEVGVEEL